MNHCFLAPHLLALLFIAATYLFVMIFVYEIFKVVKLFKTTFINLLFSAGSPVYKATTSNPFFTFPIC